MKKHFPPNNKLPDRTFFLLPFKSKYKCRLGNLSNIKKRLNGLELQFKQWIVRLGSRSNSLFLAWSAVK